MRRVPSVQDASSPAAFIAIVGGGITTLSKNLTHAKTRVLCSAKVTAKTLSKSWG